MAYAQKRRVSLTTQLHVFKRNWQKLSLSKHAYTLHFSSACSLICQKSIEYGHGDIQISDHFPPKGNRLRRLMESCFHQNPNLFGSQPGIIFGLAFRFDALLTFGIFFFSCINLTLLHRGSISFSYQFITSLSDLSSSQKYFNKNFKIYFYKNSPFFTLFQLINILFKKYF